MALCCGGHKLVPIIAKRCFLEGRNKSEEGGRKFPAVFVWCARVEGQSRVEVCGHRAALGCLVKEWGAALGCWWVWGAVCVGVLSCVCTL